MKKRYTKKLIADEGLIHQGIPVKRKYWFYNYYISPQGDGMLIAGMGKNKTIRARGFFYVREEIEDLIKTSFFNDLFLLLSFVFLGYVVVAHSPYVTSLEDLKFTGAILLIVFITKFIQKAPSIFRLILNKYTQRVYINRLNDETKRQPQQAEVKTNKERIVHFKVKPYLSTCTVTYGNVFMDNKKFCEYKTTKDPVGYSASAYVQRIGYVDGQTLGYIECPYFTSSFHKTEHDALASIRDYFIVEHTRKYNFKHEEKK